MNIETTRDYLKYTLTLSGIGFAYVSTSFVAKNSLFGLSDAIFITVILRMVIFALIIAFLGSTLLGIFAISATVRYENEMAAVPAAAAGTTPLPAAAQKALDATKKYSNWHLKSLIGAFVVGAIFFMEGFWFPAEVEKRCSVTSGGVTVSFDCSAEVSKLIQPRQP